MPKRPTRREYLDKYNKAKELYINNPNMTLKEIANILNISPQGLSNNFKKDGIHVRCTQDRKLNESIFEVIDTEEKAYWLGFLYADGCVGNKSNEIYLALQSKDYKHLEKFKTFMESSNTIRSKKVKLNGKEYKSYSFSFCSEKVKNDLIRLGCVPNKSLILNFPSETQVPSYLVKHFMRGYIDGDGSIINTPNTQCINFIGTENFIKGFCDFFDVPMNVLGKVGKSSNKRWQTYSKQTIIKLLDEIYVGANIYLERKYNNAMKLRVAV